MTDKYRSRHPNSFIPPDETEEWLIRYSLRELIERIRELGL